MKAKEMFEKLGYKNIDDNKTFLTYHNENIFKYVNFSNKNYLVFSNYGNSNDFATSISTELHQAITQQMKELGWIE